MDVASQRERRWEWIAFFCGDDEARVDGVVGEGWVMCEGWVK